MNYFKFFLLCAVLHSIPFLSDGSTLNGVAMACFGLLAIVCAVFGWIFDKMRN